MSLIPGVWDSTRWNQSYWYQPVPPAVAGWGDEWRWWFQIGNGQAAGSILELTNMVVEARWSSDSHSLGDGTFRGDIQPGKLTLRLWDPGRVLDPLPLTGLIFAHYGPGGVSFGWYHNTLTRGLFAPGDPQAADCVITADSWPPRLMTPVPSFAQPMQSVNTRLNQVLVKMNAAGNLALPNYGGDMAGQSQNVAAMVADSSGNMPSYLQAYRDASPFGVCWQDAGASGAYVGTPGQFYIRYRRWDAANFRPLDPAQIVAGPAVSRSIDFVFTSGQVAGDDPTTPAAEQITWATGALGNTTLYGNINFGPVRAWDKMDGSGPNFAAISNTVSQVVRDHGADGTKYLSSVLAQSGPRWTPTGKPSTVQWDPAAHVWSPADVADYTDPATGAHQYYRVQKTDHVLNAAVWQSTHTLDWYTAATALPP